MSAVDQYAVVGNPIAHSKSPEIHLRFAAQVKQKIGYERIEAPIDGFEEKALSLRDAGYRGLNVTVPFKLDAAKLASELTPRARLAGAVNTLKFDGDTILGDNTDGIGFVRDVTERRACAPDRGHRKGGRLCLVGLSHHPHSRSVRMER